LLIGRRVLALVLGTREHVSPDLVRIDVAIADSRQEIVDFVELEIPCQIVKLDAVHVQSFERLFDHLAPADDVFVALLAAEPLANLFTGVGGVYEAEVRVEPIARWTARTLGS